MKKLTLTLIAVAVCAAASAQMKVKYLSTNTNKFQVEQLSVDGQDVQISRTLYAGYNSICLPIGLTAEGLQNAAPGARVERLAGLRQEGSTLSLFFVDCTADGTEAGVPYLIYSPKTQIMRARVADAKNIDTEVHNITLADGKGNSITFGSSWECINGSDQRFGIPAKQDVEVLESVLIRTDASKMFLPTRCGVEWTQQSVTATNLDIRHYASANTLPTGIAAVSTNQAEKHAYDLSGRRTVAPHKGIYVVDGKKTAIK